MHGSRPGRHVSATIVSSAASLLAASYHSPRGIPARLTRVGQDFPLKKPRQLFRYASTHASTRPPRAMDPRGLLGRAVVPWAIGLSPTTLGGFAARHRGHHTTHLGFSRPRGSPFAHYSTVLLIPVTGCLSKRARHHARGGGPFLGVNVLETLVLFA